MDLMNLLSSGLLWAVLAVFIIVRQFMPRRVKPALMIGLPLVCGVLGVRGLYGAPPDTPTAIAVLVLNLALSAGLGMVRGVTVRIWQDNAHAWMVQGTLLTFICWAISIAVKVALGLAEHSAFSFDQVDLLLGVTLAAQNLVIVARMSGLPARAPVGSR